MRQQVHETYFIIRIGDERHFLFKSNVLRFRKTMHKFDINLVFLQFVLKGNNRASYVLTQDSWARFITGMPHPSEIEASQFIENSGYSEISRTDQKPAS